MAFRTRAQIVRAPQEGALRLFLRDHLPANQSVMGERLLDDLLSKIEAGRDG